MMRLNKYIASHSTLSRRAADAAIAAGRIRVNGQIATLGTQIKDGDTALLDDKPLAIYVPATVVLHKPVGYVCSRDGQGSATIYDLLSADMQHLNPVGRLDKDSSGLLLLTSDGDLLNQLAHPSHNKLKRYHVKLDKPLTTHDRKAIIIGVDIGDDRPSAFHIQALAEDSYAVTLQEGRNRQIRRTFAALGYHVTALHRTHFGPYALGDLPVGACMSLRQQ